MNNNCNNKATVSSYASGVKDVIGRTPVDRSDDFIMLPTVDYCFKELMKNEKVRIGFLAAILGIDPLKIVKAELQDTILRKHTADDKYGVLDVFVLLDDDTQIDMEMQVVYYKYWRERTIYYISKMYADSITEGSDYDKLKKTVQISILDFILFPEDDEFYSCYQLREKETGRLYSDQLEIHVLELPKLSGTRHPEDKLLYWGRFFHAKTREEFAEMATKDTYIEEAYHALDRMSMDEEMRREYDFRQKAIRDKNSLIKQGKEEGFEIGYKEGRELGLEAGRAEGLKAGRAQEIVEFGLEEEWSEEKIFQKLQMKLSISEKDAKAYFEQFAKH